MNNATKLVLLLSGLTLSVPVTADEVGPGKPSNGTSSTQQTLLSAPVDECSLLEQWFGLCETEQTSEE